MLSMLSMYLLVKCTAIQMFFIIICTTSFIIFISAFSAKWLTISDVYGEKEKEKEDARMSKKCNKFIWPFFASGCFFLLLSLAMPNTKEMAIIYVTPKVVNSVMANEELKKLPSNLVGLANSWIEEFKPDTNKVEESQARKSKKVEDKSQEKIISDSTKQAISDKVIDRVIKEVTK